RRAMGGPGDLGGAYRRVVGLEVPVVDGVGVHEVVAGTGVQAREQLRALGRVDRVPAHGRHDVGLEGLDRARPLGQALALHAELDAAGEQDLHADADAQHGTAAREAPVDDPVPARLLQTLHTGREGADTGDEEPVRVHRRVEVARYLDLGARAREGAFGGAD